MFGRIRIWALLQTSLIAFCGCTTPLIRAVNNGDYNQVQALLNRGMDPNTKGLPPIGFQGGQNICDNIFCTPAPGIGLLGFGIMLCPMSLLSPRRTPLEQALCLLSGTHSDTQLEITELLLQSDARVSSQDVRDAPPSVARLLSETHERQMAAFEQNHILAPSYNRISAVPHSAASLDSGASKNSAENGNRDSPQGTVPISAPISVNTPNYSERIHPDDFAVVVGVEKYAESLPPAEFATSDAKAVFKHLRALGVPARHIVFLSNERAGKSELVKNIERWLPMNVKSDSRVYFYFSGHGAPDPTTGDAYLLPFSGDPSDLPDTAYPLSRLYAHLSRLKAHKVIAMLDSCFSGAGGRSVIASGARPLVNQIKEGTVSPKGKLLVLTASKADQISGVLEDKRHGAFTYYLLKGLNGAALNQQDHVTLDSLYSYLKPQVEDAAHLDSRDQDPQLLPPNSPAEDIKLR